MKKQILLFTVVAGMAAIVLTSGKNGAGFQKGYNSTGSETGLGNLNGCNATGCHGTTASTDITLSVELDSAGVPQNYYTPGGLYTIKLTGTNTSSTTYPKYGFQLSAIKGSTSVVTPVNAGTLQSTGLPTNVRFTAPTVNFVCSLVEHSNPLPATTLGGAQGGTYVVSFNWTAPVAGTGTVSLWGAINVCNDDNLSTGDKWNLNKKVLSEGVLSVPEMAADIKINAYPNPVTDKLHLQIQNASGTYKLNVFDISGKTVLATTIAVKGTNPVNINSANWAPGSYHVVLEKDGARKVIRVVKQ